MCVWPREQGQNCYAIALQLTITKSGHYCHTKTSLVYVHVHVYDRV